MKQKKKIYLSRVEDARIEGKEAAKKMAASNPLLRDLVKRFDLRLDLAKLAASGTKIKDELLQG